MRNYFQCTNTLRFLYVFRPRNAPEPSQGDPDQPSVIRLVGSILLEIDDEWQAAERRYFSLETMRELTHPKVLMEDLGPLRLAPIH
ncbi:MAG: hypothetical protein KAJ53_10095 [Anaerolineales bacterium]|nr:hypothetical protein [Anaerolineales bacterium]